MRRLGHALGSLLLVLAASAAFAQVLMIWATGTYEPVSLGRIWYNIDANSLVGFQGLVERTLGSLGWLPVRLLLSLPAFVVLLVPGLLLWLGCRGARRGFA